ncbi:MAG: alpha/beta hydrolase-fold protein [Gemmatimonadaceae bacterium]
MNFTRFAYAAAFSISFGGVVTPICANSQSTTAAAPKSPDEKYGISADSRPKPGVPEGNVTAYTLADSKVYPGYKHKWWLYIPAQYDGRKPIALMVFLDGALLKFVQRDGDWRVPTVLDNLISANEVPVMAAVFVDPGERLRDSSAFDEQRSYEYDTLGDRYSQFLFTEIRPLVHAITIAESAILSNV